jgi:hypothetical protein
MMADDTIPANLADAFGAAVISYELDWDRTQPENKLVRLPDTMTYSIREVCHLVSGFDDPLPEDVARRLSNQHGFRPDLGRALTYAVGARRLIEMMDNRIAEYQRLEEDRRRRAT